MIRVHALAASDLVGVWERGMGQHPVDRALTILSACSEEPWETLARASVGRRDAALLAVYERVVSRQLEAFAECPGCAEPLEYTLQVRDLLAEEEQREGAGELAMTAGEISLRLRLPNSLDLAAAASGDASAAGQLLAERCILDARSGSSAVPVQGLPAAIVEEAETRLAEADPLAEVLIDLECAACAHRWQAVLDIESFLWVKIGALAKRLLREVHVLARAYGWREADILAMSTARREFYLEMAS